jgi:hypothetical protein
LDLTGLDSHTMGMETSLQLTMAHLLAEIDTKAEARQEKAEANAKARQAKVEAEAAACQEKAIAELKAAQAEIKADIIAKIEAGQKKNTGTVQRIENLRKRNDNLSDRDDVVSRRNGG